MIRLKSVVKIFVILGVSFNLSGCSNAKEKKAVALYRSHCASCHLAPKIEDLPKSLWKTSVLPEMGARMGIRDSSYDPYQNHSFQEQYAMMKSGIYNVKSSISKTEWELLRDYVLSNAPNTLEGANSSELKRATIEFTPKPINIDSIRGSFYTYLEFNQEKKTVITADISGNVFEYDPTTNKVEHRLALNGAITAYNESDSLSFITTVGLLNPSEISKGSIYLGRDHSLKKIPLELHRPVHTLIHDFDKNGEKEILVCEFGHLRGQLSLLVGDKNSKFEKKVLLSQPGTVRTVVKDMDKDGKDDIIVLASQGDECVAILYQSNPLNFKVDKVLRFSPLYGTSWFELVDYDGDGDEDIITVHGDNADKTQILKPYHGMRIHINDGSNHFSEKFFFPFHGATRSVSRDFDQDGDIDIAIVSAFPDYSARPERSFVYLKNKGDFNFEPYFLPEDTYGRWFLMDASDIDDDGDEDIILSSFTYFFTPVPKDLSERWEDSNIDILLLENKLNNE